MEKRTKITVIVVVMLVISVVSFASELPRSRTSPIELEVLPRSENIDQLYRYGHDAASWLAWNNRLRDSFKDYHEYTAGVERVTCSYEDRQIFGEKQVCNVPLDNLNPCAGSFDFQSARLCVFLRLKKTHNWTPVVINNTLEGLPDKMPKDLQQYIEMVHDTPEANNVWVSCEGENPADKEFIGPVEYLPRQGFPAYYFPYTNKEGYLSPLVAVWFRRPMTDILINIVCTAWAKNIKNDKEEQQSTAHFSFMME